MSLMRLTSARIATWHAPRVQWWQALFVLALLGQFLAPVFVTIHIWPFPQIGAFIYWLGATICPIAWDTPSFVGHPMIVCPLCYGALIAITAVTFSHPRPTSAWAIWEATPTLLRFVAILALVAPWLSAYVFIKAGDWALPWSSMLLFGLLGGLGTALLGQQIMDLGMPVKRGAR